MTRVLYWNIEKFAISKIATEANKRRKGATITEAEASKQRRQYIKAVMKPNAGAALPDIIVVVEVVTGYDGRGILVRGDGAMGSRRLVQTLRSTTNNPNWMLVPPLQTGRREAVAVYYDSTNYAFTGPWQWPGGTGPAFDPAAPPVPPRVAYAAPFRDYLPNRLVPAGLPNAGINERRLAAATEFTYRPGHATQAGNAINYGSRRAPYWVTFAQVNFGVVPPAVLRTFSLFAIHSPASGAADGYLRDLADVTPIDAANGVNETKLVLGDFNVNLFRENPTLTVAAAYGPMTNPAPAGRGYALGINRPGAPPAPLAGYKGYFATHMKKADNASYWSTATVPQFYPAYGYIGTDPRGNQPNDGPGRWYSIDNILARYPGGGGPMANVTILNGVAASPFNIIPPPIPGNPPVGVYVLPVSMADVGRYIPPLAQANQYGPGDATAFRGWNNFGRIRNTSDHMAIVADV